MHLLGGSYARYETRQSETEYTQRCSFDTNCCLLIFLQRYMNINQSEITCYMCEKPATSVEHIPPKCLFPEQKDLPGGADLRKQLLTVPACDEHNLKKYQVLEGNQSKMIRLHFYEGCRLLLIYAAE